MEERIKSLKIGDSLTEKEKSLLIEVLYNWKEAITFEFEEKDIVRSEVEPLHKILMIEHKAW